MISPVASQCHSPQIQDYDFGEYSSHCMDPDKAFSNEIDNAIE